MQTWLDLVLAGAILLLGVAMVVATLTEHGGLRHTHSEFPVEVE